MKCENAATEAPAPPSPPRRSRRWLRIAAHSAGFTLGTIALLWSAAAIWFDGPRSRWLTVILILLLAGTATFAAVRLRPLWKAHSLLAALFAAVLGWWLMIPPRNDRAWQPDVARPPRASHAGSSVTIENVRNFNYRTNDDFDQTWETRTYDLDKIVGLDMTLSFWGPTLIAHTIMSWEFSDGQFLAISIETRKEVGEEYSAVRGFFRQFELYYVVADERDVIGLRARHRAEEVYLYRFRTPPAAARAILEQYLAQINRLADRPQWYNALTENCTTMVRYHARHAVPVKPWSWQVLLNGYLDKMLYDNGVLDNSLPFDELRRRSLISDAAKSAADADFSRSIRAGLPLRPASR